LSSINPKVLPYLQLYLDNYGTSMLTCLVIVSRQPDRSAPCSRLAVLSQVTKSPVVHPVSVQQLTKCSSRKSFFLKTIHFDGGCAPSLLTLSRPRLLLPYILSPIPFLFTHLRTLLRYFVFSCTHQICNSFLFKRFRTLWQKRPGWGTPSLSQEQNEAIPGNLRSITRPFNPSCLRRRSRLSPRC